MDVSELPPIQIEVLRKHYAELVPHAVLYNVARGYLADGIGGELELEKCRRMLDSILAHIQLVKNRG